MIQIVSISQKPPSKSPCAIAIGAFDGIHVGHRELIRRTVEQAEAAGLVPAVFTFAPSSDFKMGERLCPREESFRMMEELGIRLIYEADFASIRSLSPSDFVGRVLVGVCDARVALCGFNFRFGKGAAANADDLYQMMSGHGREVIRVDDVSLFGKKVSTTEIKARLAEGEVGIANTMLGETYHSTGVVEHGNGKGASLGFPTVNFKTEKHNLLRRGVYRTATLADGGLYPSITNVGTCPTLGAREEHAETFILDFNSDLYGKAVTVYFLDFMRDETVFSSVEELKEQVINDINRAKKEFSDNGRKLD